MKKILILLTSIVLTIQAYAGTYIGDSYFVSANTRTDSVLIRPKNGLITISANKLIVFSNQAVQFTKAVTVQDTIVCDSIILSNGFVISAYTLSKLGGIYVNDSALIKTAMRSWNASLAKTIDASDTSYWGRTETDPLSFKLTDSTTANGAAKNWKMINLLSTKLATNGSAANLTSFPTLNQNTTGTAAGLTAQYIDWNSASGGSSIANKPTILTAANVGAQIHDTVTNAYLIQSNYINSLQKLRLNPTVSEAFLTGNSSNEVVINNSNINIWTLGGYIKGWGNYSACMDYSPLSSQPAYAFKSSIYSGMGYDGENVYILSGSGYSIKLKNNTDITGDLTISGILHGGSKYDTLSSTATVITYNAAVNPYRTDTIGENHTYTIIGTVNGSKGQLNVTLTATATLSFPAGILADGQSFTSLAAGVYNICWEKVQGTFNYNIKKYNTYTP